MIPAAVATVAFSPSQQLAKKCFELNVDNKQSLDTSNITNNKELQSLNKEQCNDNMIKQQRKICCLPLPSITEFTPFNQSNFDQSVLDFCSNKISLNNDDTKPICQTSANSKQAYQQQTQQHNKFQATATATANKLIEKAKSLHQGSYHFNYRHQLPATTNIQTSANKYKIDSCVTSGAYTRNLAARVTTKSCKVILSGDVAVGKTSLLNRFGRDAYSTAYHTTIGVDFDLQKFNILGHQFILQLWDTAGLERFKCITASYYRGCQVALLVFDVSNLDSLANVLRWKDEIFEMSKAKHPTSFNVNGDDKISNNKSSHNHQDQEPLLFLVGTKNDLPLSNSHRRFVQDQANKIAKNLEAELWFVSARTGENVTPFFNRVAALAFNKCLLNEIQQIRFEVSALSSGFKDDITKQKTKFWSSQNRFIKITKKKDGDEKRSKCINVQCVIK